MKNSKNYSLLFVLLGLLFTSTSFGQSPCFTADYSTVCVGTEVTFTQCPGWTNVSYDFGDGAGEQLVGTTKVTYSEPGIKEVFSFGNVTGSNGSLNAISDGPLIINVVKPTAPTFLISRCSNRNVKITLNDNAYQTYTIDWELASGTPLIKGATTSLPYTTPGEKTIRISGTAASGCTADTSFTFEVFNDVAAPEITQLNVQSGQINLTFESTSLKDYLFYRIEVKEENGSYYNAGNLIKDNNSYSPSYTISSVTGLGTITTNEKKYCVRITAYDECGNGKSDEACTILLNAQAQMDQNEAQWSSGQTFSSYSLKENERLINLSGSSNNHLTPNTVCNNEYCYRITGSNGNVVVESNEVCVLGKSNKIPPPVESLNTLIEDNKAKVTWIRPEGIKVREFVVTRSSNQQNTIIYKGAGLSLSDDDLDVSTSQGCYSIHYVDSCGNASPESSLVCTMLLNAELTSKDNNKLHWTEFTGWQNGVQQYVIQYLDKEGTVYREVPVGISSQYIDTERHDEQVIRYRIMAVSNDPAPLLSFSNISEIKQNFLIVLPNAFTPNGDGKNEDFHPVGRFIKEYVMQIYNRWGELVFEGQAWDGRAKSGPAPSGTYICYVEAEDYTGNKISKKGSLILIR